MAVQGFWAVLYYGILASFTGGYLPVRAKNLWLVIFHLYLFLTFIVFPLAVYLIDPSHFAGWLVYGLFVLASFIVLKLYNLRLHKSLGTDPEPELEPEKEEEEEEEDEGEEGRNGEKQSEEEKSTSGTAARADEEAPEILGGEREAKVEVEPAASPPPILRPKTESSPELIDGESLQRHRDSASTLGQSSSYTPHSESLELGGLPATANSDSSSGPGERAGGGDEETVLLSDRSSEEYTETTASTLHAIDEEAEVREAEVRASPEAVEEGEVLPSLLPPGSGTAESSKLDSVPTIAIPGAVEDTPTSQTPPLRFTSIDLSPAPPQDVILSVEDTDQPLMSPEAQEQDLSSSHERDLNASLLMSPVHRSNSNVQGSSRHIENYISILASFSQPSGEEEAASAAPPGLQRSCSMPPSMFEQGPRRDRMRVCIRQNRGSRHDRRFTSSHSEDPITRGEEEDEGEEEGTSVLERTYPMHRRRHGIRRRGYSMEAGSRSVRPPSPLLGLAASLPPAETDEEDGESEDDGKQAFLESVKHKLLDDGHLTLLSIAEKMPAGLHEAILDDSLPPGCYGNLTARVGELERGHLASGDADSSPGAVHWFEVSGEWDFYKFQGEEEGESGREVVPALPSGETHQTDDYMEGIERLQQEILYRYGLDIDDLGGFPSSLTPPHPPPRPSHTLGGDEEAEEETKPTFEIIPWVKKTSITLDFERRQLEEFMDRNVAWTEALLTVVLATLVCAIAALLLRIDFYQDFWLFWFCFVVATAHFSLIKSVQDDPASPSPGQNHITALSRAVYFILVGSLALVLTAFLDRGGFSPLLVYGFNINSESVLMFVRNGFLIFILFFPILFILGWLPQSDTFAIYFLEQIDIHVFGGTASTGLVCSFYAVFRSILAAALLWPLGYAAFSALEGELVPDVDVECFSPDFNPSNRGQCIGQCVVNDRVALSFFLGALFAVSFALSRSTSNHQYIRDLFMRGCRKLKSCMQKETAAKTEQDLTDPLEKIYCDTLYYRLISDFFAGVFIFVFVTGLNLTTVFCLSEIPAYVIYGITCVLGIVNHYLLPHIRKEMPWLCCSEPILKAEEWDSFEVSETPSVSVLERLLQMGLFLEKNIFYPLSFLYAFNLNLLRYKATFGDFGAALVLTVTGMKLIRSSFTELSRQHIIFIFTLLFFNFDYAHLSEGLPLDYFILAILFYKFYDLFLKLYFIYIYIAPWQTSWSSPGHIIVQPLLVPHSPVIFFMALIGSIMGAPINPLMASTFFLLSYVRPIKYWEKNYNTKRSDSSNTRLDSQLEGNLRNPNPDRLDSLFYEHLTWALQRSLCGDLLLGRWGRVTAGDFFILTSDRLNALVHIIEIGNGFVTFQLRGLEFRGTYCHQREVEAITESIADDEGCCCYDPGHLPGMLSCNKALGSRWLAWEVVSTCYTLHGYSISENQAHLVFNSYDYKKSYITYYSKCIIYKLIRSEKLHLLMNNEQIREALAPLARPSYVDVDAVFDESRNCDFSHSTGGGILREKFADVFLPFISVCVEQQEGLEVETDSGSFLVTLCFAFSLLGRRMFFQHAQTGASRRGGDNFMNGLYRMFLGDARPNSPNDEWVFADVDSIQEIIIPAARIALKVHQDNFTFSEDYETAVGVYEAIKDVEENHVVTHENDRAWRNAVVMNKPSLLALRYQRTEESYIYPYKLIRLSSKFIKFKVIKLNRECVRALWTSQQHELIFLRNHDSERGSIQNHKQTLRNMINSSMDLPIGYPIYVSPLQTSFADRHETYNSTFLGKISNPLEIAKAVDVIKGWCETCAKHYQGSRSQPHPKGSPARQPGEGAEGGAESQMQETESVDSLTGMQYGGQDYEDPFPDSDSDSELWKPMWVSKLIVIVDASEIFETFNVNWLKWPDSHWAQKAMKSSWKSWRPQEGMEGEVVHEWRPFHIDSTQRSHIDKVILLVKMSEEHEHYVLVREQGVKEV